MRRITLILLTIILVGSIAQIASAQTKASRFRMNLDTTLFSFGRYTSEAELSDEEPDELDAESTEYTSTSIGFGDGIGSSSVPMFGLGLGFVATENWTIGAKLQLGGGAYNYELAGFSSAEIEMRTFAYAALPYVEYKFLTGPIQPFILATLGYRGYTGWSKENEDQKTFNHLFEFGGAVGTHFFVGDNVSVDVSILACGDVGKTKSKMELPGEIEDLETSIRGFKLAAIVGLSGWF
ncbi:MAG: hypothetical protein GY847_31860 [Proteobacteria bacterium]|nr:hypothetical protein [Pseudomonadota bacterium]